MKRRTLIVLVGLSGVAFLLFLGRGMLDDQDDTPAVKGAKRDLAAPKPSEHSLTVTSLKGCWVIYLHYPDETVAVEIVIDGQGNARKRTGIPSEGMVVSIRKDGTVLMRNENISLPGSMGQADDRIEGMATLRDHRQPVPFSCLKVRTCPDER